MKEENESESASDTESDSDFETSKKRSGRFPSSNNIDIEFLAKLYQDSKISGIKKNSIKKKKWQEITVKYCNEKNLPLMDYKTLSRKWSRVFNYARKGMRVGRTKNLHELILAAAEGADADPPSDSDCESGAGVDHGKFAMTYLT